jgi:type VI secretion system protein ImpG
VRRAILMEELLPHYERELALLRSHAGDFARRHPKIAGRLMMTGDVGQDPHVERLIQSFALLAARVNKRIDDDFPLFTESFLEVLYPHYLRPFPSCAIARFDASQAVSQTSTAQIVPRGSVLTSRPVRGVACKFTTAYATQLAPMALRSARFRAAVVPSAGTAWPVQATSMLSLEFELLSPQARWSELGLDVIRAYIDGESSQVAAIREALLGRATAAFMQIGPHAAWTPMPSGLPRAVGFAEDEALIEGDGRSQPAYRLLTEYFAFPEKFAFVDLPLPREALAAADAAGSRALTLHIALVGVRPDTDEGRLLETTSERNVVLGCTPVINLFAQRADPIRVTHQSSSYPVLPDARRAYGFEVYGIDKVWRLRKSAQGESIDEFRPFFALQHHHLVDEGENAARYWSAHRDDDLAERSPGYETELSIVDIDFDPAEPGTDTLSVQVRATNRDLPTHLSTGNPGGDLFLDGGSLAKEIRLLRKPTPPQRFERGSGNLWRLISHLSLNHLSLTAGGIDALREMLRLYDLPRSAVNARQIAGLVEVDFESASAWLPGEPFPCLVRGTGIRLVVDESHFTGSGLSLFVRVLDHFFGLYAHINTFTRLRVYSSRTRELLVSCPERSGDLPLL